MEELKLQKILACGTIRASRKVSPHFKRKKLWIEEILTIDQKANGITVFKWKHIISNYHSIYLSSVKRREKDGRKTTVFCPSAVSDYNDHMGGLDTHDQLRQLLGIHRKIIKWWHRIFLRLFDTVIVNAFLAHRESWVYPHDTIRVQKRIRPISA